MLCRVLNTCWGDQGTNVELYGDLPTLSDRIGFRRLEFASHCRRHRELQASLSCGGQHTDIYVLAVSISRGGSRGRVQGVRTPPPPT